jgi:hypothetical protein
MACSRVSKGYLLACKDLMRFGVGCSFYQDVNGLKRLLRSIDSRVDLCILIDGRYPSFGRGKSPALPPLSTDGSREVCKQYDNTLLVDLPATQIAKRNAYLQLSKRYALDFLLILDSDEYIGKAADWDMFKREAEKRVNLDLRMYRIYDLRYEDTEGWNNGQRPRVFFRPWEIRYDIKHYRWVIKAKNHLDRPVYEGNHGRFLLPGIAIKHDRFVRGPERNKDMDLYEDWLIHQENKSMKRKYRLPS